MIALHDISPDILLSKGENNDDSSFTPAQVAQPMGQAAADNVGGAPTLFTRGMVLHEVCKRAADKLDIPCPKVQAETSVSRYEGKRLAKAKRATR